MSQRSCLLMPPGSGNALRLRPVRTRIDVSPRPSLVRSSFPSAGRPATPSRDQLFVCFLPAGTCRVATQPTVCECREGAREGGARRRAESQSRLRSSTRMMRDTHRQRRCRCGSSKTVISSSLVQGGRSLDAIRCEQECVRAVDRRVCASAMREGYRQRSLRNPPCGTGGCRRQGTA
jgi:hypothetical protein